MFSRSVLIALVGAAIALQSKAQPYPASAFETEARAAAVEETQQLPGGHTVSGPTGLRPVSLDDLTSGSGGLSTGWTYDYYPTGGMGSQPWVIRVTVEPGQGPVVTRSSTFENRVPFTSWLDSPEALARLLSADLGSGWSGQALLDTYEDAAITQFDAGTPDGSQTPVWSLRVSSEACDVWVSAKLSVVHGVIVQSVRPGVALGTCGSPPPPPEPPADRFFPLAIGNEWTYALSAAEVFGSTSCPPSLRGYQRLAVVRDTALAGDPAVVMACESIDLSGSRTPPVEYVVDIDSADGRPVVLAPVRGAGECVPNLSPGPTYFLPSFSSPDHVVIGGQTYSPGRVRAYSTQDDIRGEFSSTWKYALDIGLHEYVSGGSSTHGPQPYCRISRRSLEHAVVGDQVYGASPVHTASPPPDGPVQIRLGSNPTRGRMTFWAESLTPVRATASAYDLLGRRVWSAPLTIREGPATATLPSLPAGSYVLRVETEKGGASARFVVAR